MAEMSYPLNLDTYIGADVVQLWHYGRTTGVFSADDNLRVVPGTGMNITVYPGAAWIHFSQFGGIVYGNTLNMQLQIAMAHGILHRIDRVIVRYNRSANTVRLAIRQGEYASNPVAPALQRDAEAYELAIADVRVNAGSISVSAGIITDQRLNETVCGLVRDGVERIPTQMLQTMWESWFAQFQAGAQTASNEFTAWAALFKAESRAVFDAWFNALKESLSADELGNIIMRLAGTTYIAKRSEILITASGWTYNATLKRYEYVITDNKITADAIVFVSVVGSMIGSAGLDGGETAAGKTTLISINKPTADYNALMVILREGTADDGPEYRFYADGQSIAIRPVSGSAIRVRPSSTGNLVFNGVSKSVTGGVEIDMTAAQGVNMLSVSTGTMLVSYLRSSMDIIATLTQETSDTGPIATIWPVDGLPLDVTARLISAQEGEGDPSPENARRIVGKSAASVTRSGQNIAQANYAFPQTASGVNATYYASTQEFEINGTAGANMQVIVLNNSPMAMRPGLPITLYAEAISGTSSLLTSLYVLPKKNGAQIPELTIGSMALAIPASGISRTNIQIPQEWVDVGINQIRIDLRASTGAVFTNYKVRVMVAPGIYAGPWMPAKAWNTYPVTLPEELGGLPGAKNEVRSDGTIVKRTQKFVLDGATNKFYAKTGHVGNHAYSYVGAISSIKGSTTNIISTHFLYNAGTYTQNVVGMSVAASGWVYLGFGLSSPIDTLEKANAWLAAEYAAGRPVTVEYELATPQTLTINPITIPALPGVNHIWSDGGGDTTAAGRLSPQHAQERTDARLSALEALTTQ